MAEPKGNTPRAVSSAPAQRIAPKKFAAPENIPEHFGVETQAEDHIQGIVATKDIRELLSAFGVPERNGMTFPFQHMKKAHGEIWSIRIEAEGTHTIDGEVAKGHRWVYMRQFPESVGAAA
jgi:hypothetical protein